MKASLSTDRYSVYPGHFDGTSHDDAACVTDRVNIAVAAAQYLGSKAHICFGPTQVVIWIEGDPSHDFHDYGGENNKVPADGWTTSETFQNTIDTALARRKTYLRYGNGN